MAITKPSLFQRMLLLIIAIAIALPSTASATEFGFPNDDIRESAEEAYNVKWSEIESFLNSGFAALSTWLLDTESDIWVKKSSDGTISYYFNTPDLKKYITNLAQQLNTGGFSIETFDSGEEDSSAWVTAEKKYGYHLPRVVYYGETPVLFVGLSDIVSANTGVLKSVSIAISGGVYFTAGAWDALMGFFGIDSNAQEAADSSVVDYSTDLIKSITYANDDYISTKTSEYYEELGEWIIDNWSVISQLDIDIDDENLFEQILEDDESISDLSASELIGRIINICGSSYEEILSTIMLCDGTSSDPPSTYVLRNMPYDITSMSTASAEYMNNISDPRVEMFQVMASGSIIGILASISAELTAGVAYVIVNGVAGNMMYLASVLDSMTSFKWLSGEGLDPTMLWQGTVGFMVEALIIILCLISLIATVAKYLTGSGSKGGIVSKIIYTSLTMIITVIIMVNPAGWGKTITDTLDKIIDIGAVSMSYDDDFQQLYDSNADTQQISSLRYWYFYANAWSSYVTNHTLSSDASDYDESQEASGHNEYVDFENPAELASGKKMNLWPIIAIELAREGNTNALYRVVDHYMAPLITPSDTDWEEFTVEVNEFYNGYICDTIQPAVVVAAIVILVLAFFKFLAFLELAIEILLLFIKVLVNALNSAEPLGGFKDSLSNIGGSLAKIIVYDLIITIIIYIFMVEVDVSGGFTPILFTAAKIACGGFILYFLVWKPFARGETNFLTPTLFQAGSNFINSVSRGIDSVRGMHKCKDDVKKDKEEQDTNNKRKKKKEIVGTKPEKLKELEDRHAGFFAEGGESVEVDNAQTDEGSEEGAEEAAGEVEVDNDVADTTADAEGVQAEQLDFTGENTADINIDNQVEVADNAVAGVVDNQTPNNNVGADASQRNPLKGARIPKIKINPSMIADEDNGATSRNTSKTKGITIDNEESEDENDDK